MSESAPRVAAVVVSYEGREVVLQALSSLRAMSYPAFDLFLVDNASTDGTGEAVAAAHPSVAQLRLDENRGSSGGYAAGFRHAWREGYDYALLLNNDIEVEPDMLDHLVAVAQSDPSIGCVGPKCRFFDERSRLWSAGGVLRFRESVTRERGYGEIDRGQYDHDEEVDYINGCAILVRRGALEAAGGWDPIFHICVDDADFCARVKAAGFRCVYAHRAVLYHMVSFSTGGYRPGRNFQLGRSSAIYARRHATAPQLARFLAFSLAAFPVAFLRELPRRNQAAAWAKLRGVWAGLRESLPPPPSVDGPVGAWPPRHDRRPVTRS